MDNRAHTRSKVLVSVDPSTYICVQSLEQATMPNASKCILITDNKYSVLL